MSYEITSTTKYSFIIEIIIIIFSVVGIIGNSLTFYILTKPKFLKKSIYRYFLASDIVSLLTLVGLWVRIITYFLEWNVSIILCKLYNMFLYSFYDFYAWVNVLNSIDRFITLKYQNKFRFTQKFKYQVLVLGLLFLIMVLSNVPRVIIVEKANFTICGINDSQIGFYVTLENMLLSIVVPFFIMLTSTILTVCHLLTQKQKLKQNTKNYRREKSFIKSVFTMDLWFLLCYSPTCITNFLLFAIDYNEELVNVFNYATIASTMEFTCSFFVYLFCNKLFRQYFFSMICKKLKS